MNRQIPVFIDTASSSATPYRETLRGLKSAAQKSGLKIMTVSEKEMPTHPFAEYPGVSVIASDSLSYIREVLSALRASGCRAVLAGLDSEQFGPDVSCATPSRRSETQQMMNYLYSLGIRKAALVGYGTASINDMFRYHALLSAADALDMDIGEADAFLWHRDPEDAFGAFLSSPVSYPCAICPNDNVAIQFIRRCKSIGRRVPEELYVASFGDKIIGRYYTPSVTTMTMDMALVGEQTFAAWQYLSRLPRENRTALRFTVPSRLLVRESTGGRPYDPENISPGGMMKNDPFYSLPHVIPLTLLENCLTACDELDIRILSLLMQGASYEKISEALYISDSALYYRLNRIYESAGRKGRADFVAFVREQLDSENPFARGIG